MVELEQLRKERREKVKAVFDKLIKEYEAFEWDEKAWTEYLDAISLFHKYSFSNVMLILAQRPGATRVAGFRTWKKLGRYVRKGEKGIAIFAPTFGKVRRRELREKTDPETGKVVEEWDVIEDTVLKYFIIVHVFDVGQTEGKPLPKPPLEQIVGDYPKEKEIMEIVAKKYVGDIRYEELRPGHHGYYSIKEKFIVINKMDNTFHHASTLVHELAHHLTFTKEEIIKRIREMYKKQAPEVKISFDDLLEVIAESSAYIVVKHLGLDIARYAFGYMRLYRGTPDILHKIGEMVTKISSQIINDVESTFGGGNMEGLLDRVLIILSEMTEYFGYKPYLSYSAVAVAGEDRVEIMTSEPERFWEFMNDTKRDDVMGVVFVPEGVDKVIALDLKEFKQPYV